MYNLYITYYAMANMQCCCPPDHGLGLEAKFAGLGLGLERFGLDNNTGK